MANGSDHRNGAALGLGAVAALNWRDGNHWMTHPVIASATGWACGTLPDVLEPATSPNHRQFLHSVLFAGLLIYGVFSSVQGHFRLPRTSYREPYC